MQNSREPHCELGCVPAQKSGRVSQKKIKTEAGAACPNRVQGVFNSQGQIKHTKIGSAASLR
jgi:hypothetical protein